MGNADMDGERPDSTPQRPKDEPDSFWQLVGRVTMLGWDLVVPIVGGVLLGRYLDDRFDKEFTWTLSLLAMGVVVAFYNLYTMYVEHGDGGSPRKRTWKRRLDEDEESRNHAQKDQ
ncbi:MAG TPA: AtpZ/AtpI family protein [Anaerolineae bacterium]|nr:AtpZ/AtpI family protein [Anaerolineae bacterium]